MVERVLIMFHTSFGFSDWGLKRKVLQALSVHHNGTANVLLDASKTINNAKQGKHQAGSKPHAQVIFIF